MDRQKAPRRARHAIVRQTAVKVSCQRDRPPLKADPLTSFFCETFYAWRRRPTTILSPPYLFLAPATCRRFLARLRCCYRDLSPRKKNEQS